MSAHLIPLAILSAVTSPTAMAAVLVILRRPGALRLLTAYVVASFLASVLIGFAIVAGLEAIDVLTPRHRADVPILAISLGTLIVLGTVWFEFARSAEFRRKASEQRARRKTRKQASEEEKNRLSRVLATGSIGLIAALGVAMHLPGLLYLIALANIAETSANKAHVLILLILFNIIMLAPSNRRCLGTSPRRKRPRKPENA